MGVMWQNNKRRKNDKTKKFKKLKKQNQNEKYRNNNNGQQRHRKQMNGRRGHTMQRELEAAAINTRKQVQNSPAQHVTPHRATFKVHVLFILFFFRLLLGRWQCHSIEIKRWN